MFLYKLALVLALLLRSSSPDVFYFLFSIVSVGAAAATAEQHTWVLSLDGGVCCLVVFIETFLAIVRQVEYIIR